MAGTWRTIAATKLANCTRASSVSGVVAEPGL
jgi:hypothetical protein